MDIFYALADPTRRDILEMLAENVQLTATDIYNRFKVSASAISQHLKVLREAKLVVVHKDKQMRIYEINKDGLKDLDFWLEKLKTNWEGRFNALDKLLEEEKKKLAQPTAIEPKPTSSGQLMNAEEIL